jgi:hypothetical protein
MSPSAAMEAVERQGGITADDASRLVLSMLDGTITDARDVARFEEAVGYEVLAVTASKIPMPEAPAAP